MYLCRNVAIVQNHWFKWMHVIRNSSDDDDESNQRNENFSGRKQRENEFSENNNDSVCMYGHAYTSFVLLFGLCTHIIFNGFVFFLVKCFTTLSHWVMCYFKHVVNYSTILSLTSLVRVNCNLYFCRQYGFSFFSSLFFSFSLFCSVCVRVFYLLILQLCIGRSMCVNSTIFGLNHKQK